MTELTESKHNEPKPQVGLRQKIPVFIQRIQTQEQYYLGHFQQLEGNFRKQAEQQIQSYFLKARETFNKNKKNLEKELVTLKYYSEHAEQNHNLYPLFVQIDEKLIYNVNLIEQNTLTLTLPYPNPADLDQEVLTRKLTLYEGYIEQLVEIVQSEAVKKYCKKEAEASEKIMNMFTSLLDHAKETVYTSEVKIRKSFEEVIAELPRYKHVETMILSVMAPKGIMSVQNYHSLISGLHPNKSFIGELQLKIMDMEFSQEKADILRKRLNQEFKHLKRIAIQNYYKECKLGQFQDFNWKPYRKQVHITAAVW